MNVQEIVEGIHVVKRPCEPASSQAQLGKVQCALRKNSPGQGTHLEVDRNAARLTASRCCNTYLPNTSWRPARRSDSSVSDSEYGPATFSLRRHTLAPGCGGILQVLVVKKLLSRKVCSQQKDSRQKGGRFPARADLLTQKDPTNSEACNGMYVNAHDYRMAAVASNMHLSSLAIELDFGNLSR